MSKRVPKNIAASVHQRLLTLAKERGEDPNLILIHYAIERFLYRLSKTKEKDQFVLKGAMLFAVWTDKPHRSTRDLDLLASVVSSSEQVILFIKRICDIQVEDDGLIFDAGSIQVEEIKLEDEYEGSRVRLNACLGKVKIRIQIDIAFGDIVTPKVQNIEYPVLLDFPRPKLLAYPPESVIAEKLQAIVNLGMANSRMKDYYDIYILIQQFSFQPKILLKAIQTTFRQRRTDVPNIIPSGLSETFAGDKNKQKQWSGFIKRNQIQDAPEKLETVVNKLQNYFVPDYL